LNFIMPRTAETASFKFNHTMIRVKDPKASLDFYQRILGMDLISKIALSDFTVYFVAFNHSGRELTDDEKEKTRFTREGVLELTHNHGTESDPNFQGYASGNTDPGRGFGHIAICVDDVDKACERFEKLGVQFKKKPNEGKLKNIAFILDPDGYWIEIVPEYLDL